MLASLKVKTGSLGISPKKGKEKSNMPTQKTTAKGKPLVWENVATGIYRYLPNGKYYERVRVGKKGTWVKIEAACLSDAKKIRAARITRNALQVEGIAPAE